MNKNLNDYQNNIESNMKLLIKSNGKMNNVNIEKDNNGNIYSIEIDFEPPYFYADFEMWLQNQDDEFLDYMKLCISQRNKLKAYKR